MAQWAVSLGDVVLIADQARLQAVLDEFSPTLDCIAPLTVEDIAHQYGTVVDIKSFQDPTMEHNDFAILLLENGNDVALPLAAFDVMQMEILEASDEDPYAKLQKREQQAAAALKRMASLGTIQEQEIVRELAAECIQAAFRRHRRCKSVKQMRKHKSVERLVKNMAAETITRSLRRSISNGSLRRNRSTDGDASVHSDASQSPSVHTVGPPASPRSFRETGLGGIAMVESLAAGSDPVITLPVEAKSVPAAPAPCPALQPEPKREPGAEQPPSHSPSQAPSQPPPPAAHPTAIVLSDIRLQALPTAIASQTNSVYFVCEVDNWAFRSPTLLNTGSKAFWAGPQVHVPMGEGTSVLRVYVFHECEVLADKLLGSLQVPLATLLAPSGYSATLYDSTNIIKRKARGDAAFQHHPAFGPSPSFANFAVQVSQKLLDDTSVRSAESRFVSITQEGSAEGNERQPLPPLGPAKGVPLTMSQLVRASNILRQTELDSDRVEDVSGVTVTARTTLSDPPLSDPKPQAQRKETQTRSREAPQRRKSASTTQPAPQPVFQASPAPPVPVPAPPAKRRLSMAASLSSAPVNSSSSSAPPRTLVDQIVQSGSVDYLFDHAFRLAFLELASSVTMRVEELLVLLDALGVLPQGAVRCDSAVRSERVCVPITSPSALAAALAAMHARYLSAPARGAPLRVTTQPGDEADFLDPAIAEHGGFSVTEAHANLCLHHLTQLLAGSYVNIRGMLFLACCTAPRANPSTAAGIGSEGAAHVDTRPSKLSAKWVDRLLVAMGLAEAQATAPVTEQRGLLERSASDLGRELNLKSSLLQARLSVYRRCLMRLDRYWQRGLRPNDRLQTAPTDAPHGITVSSIMSFVDQGLGEEDEDSTVATPSTLQTSSSAAGTGAGTLKPLVFGSAEELSEAYAALSRAYAWGLGPLDASSLAHLIISFTVFPVRSLDDDDDIARDVGRRHCEDEARWVEVRGATRDKLRRLRAAVPAHMVASAVRPADTALVVEAGTRLFVKLPRSGTRGASARTVQLPVASSSPFFTADQVCVGMSVATLPQPYLQRVYSTVVDKWWERPPAKQIQAMAAQLGTVVSVADLVSRGLVGVRLQRAEICDAVPLEGLLRASAAEGGLSKGPPRTIKEETGGIKKLLQLKRKASKKKDKSKKKDTEPGKSKPTPAETGPSDGGVHEPLVADEALSLQSVDSKPPPAAAPLQQPLKVQHNLYAGVPSNQRGMSGAARPHSAPGLARMVPPFRASSEAEEARDYSWLRPIPREDFPAPGEGDQALPTTGDAVQEAPGRRGPDKEKREEGVRTRVVLHQREAGFDLHSAVFASGLQPPPSAGSPDYPLREGEVRISSPKPLHWDAKQGGAPRPKSAGQRAPWRPSSANPTPSDAAVEEPHLASASPGALAVSGAAYKQGGGLGEPIDHAPTSGDEVLCAGGDTRKKRKSKPRRVYQNFFDAQAASASPAEEGEEGDWGVKGSVMPLAASPSRRRSKSPKLFRAEQPVDEHSTSGAVKPSVVAREGADEGLALSDHLSDEDADKDIRFSVEVVSPRQQGASRPISLQEQLYLNREKARSAKEIDHKEKYLLKELKRLGVR